MSRKCLMVGDSRMANIGEYNQGLKHKSKATVNGGKNDVVGQGKDGNYYYAAGGKDYSWFAANVSKIAETAKNQDCKYVVINMGVNDWPNFLNKTSDGGGVNKAGAQKMANNYLTLAKQIEKKSGKKVVFVTPYPLHDEYKRNSYNGDYDRSRKSINAGLEKFNSCLRSGAEQNGFGFIDIYTEIKSKYLDDDRYWADKVHGNEKLNEVVTSLINKGLDNLQVQAKTQTAQKTSPETTTTSRSDQENQSSTQSTNNTNENSQSSLTKIIHWLYQKLEQNESENNRDDKPNQQNNSQNLTEKQKNNMSRWAKRVGLSNDEVQRLIEKYGDNAYNLMLKAMMEPRYLAGYIGEAPRSSRKTVELLLNLDEKQAQVLLNKYSLKGSVNVSASNDTEEREKEKPQKKQNSQKSTTTVKQTNNRNQSVPAETVAKTKPSALSAINFRDPKVVNAFVEHAHKVRVAAYKYKKMPAPNKSDTEKIIKKIITESVEKKIDPCLALAVAETESCFVTTAGSSAGAYGLFQLMPNNITGFEGDRKNVWQNISGGIGFLADNQTAYESNLVKTLVAYNAGPGNLKGGIRDGLKGSALDRITDRQCYAHTVIAKIDEYRKLAGGNTGIYAYYFGNESINHYKGQRHQVRKTKKKKSSGNNYKAVATVRKKGRGGRA